MNRSPNSAASAFGAEVNGKYESKLTGPVRVTARQMNPRQLLNLCNTANEEFVPKEAMYLVCLGELQTICDPWPSQYGEIREHPDSKPMLGPILAPSAPRLT